jgi:uncharacterized membrane protein
MSDGVIPELRHAVDLMAQSHDAEGAGGDASSPATSVLAEADHILGPILEHAEPSHIYTDHLLGPDHTDAPHPSAYVEVAHAPTQLEPAQMEPAYVAAPSVVAAAFVASGEKPVEPAAAEAQQAALAARSAGDPAPRRLNMARSAETVVDPVLAGFDHVVALLGYGLLFISVFLLGVPALAAAALAYAHNRDSHLLVATHYRFQLRIFWTAVLLLLLAVASLAGSSVILLQQVFDFARDHLPGMSGVIGHGPAPWTVPLAGALGLAFFVFLALAVGWTLIASVVGFFRLLGNKPIGHLPA